MEADAPPSHASATLPPVVFVYLGVMIVTWAGNWPLMKLALGQVPPLVFVLLRLIGSVALVGPALLLARQSLLPARGERLGLFWVGQLQVAGFLICSIIGLAIVPAGRAIVLAYTMPLWAIPIGLLLWREPLGRNQLAGAAVGFAGLVLFMNPTLLDWRNGQILAGNILLLVAAFTWALGSCLYRRRLWRSSFWVQTLWQLAVSIIPVGAIVLIGPIAVAGPVGGEAVHWSPAFVAIAAYNCIVTTALGYFLWGKVLTMMPAATGRTSTDVDPARRFRAVYPDIRRHHLRRRGRQHRADRRWNIHDAATVMHWFYCWPQTASDRRSFTATRLGWLAAPLYLLLYQRPDTLPLGRWGGDAKLTDAFEK